MLNKFSDEGFRRLTFFNVLQLFAITLGWSLIFLFFNKKGFSLVEFIIFYNFACFSAVLALIIVKTINLRKFIAIGNLIRASQFLMAAVLLFTSSVTYLKIEFYLIAFLWGISFLIFWVPFNIIAFSYSSDQSKATTSGIYSVTAIIIGIISPLAAGLIAHNFGYVYVFFLSAILLAISGALAFSAKKEDYRGFENITYDVKESLNSMGKAKFTALFDGMMNSVSMLLIPVITIFFFQGEIEYGSFFSIVNFASAIAALIFVTRSDKKQDRWTYILISGILLSISFGIASFSNNPIMWTLSILAISFIYNILAPFSTTIVLDCAKDMPKAMIGRELMLNTGRIIGGLIILFFAIFNQTRFVFLVFASIALIYIFTIKKLKIYS